MRTEEPESFEVPPEEAASNRSAGSSREETDLECEEASFPIVCAGASAGGLEALTTLLRTLPPETGMAFILVQHLGPTHASMLSEILARVTSMPVEEARDGMRVEPDHIYVMPPASNMLISGGTLMISARHEPPGLHRPIDEFLRSLAEDQGAHAIGIVLSGSATDGTLGLEEIKAAGGITFAQDDTAEHVSMPHSAIEAGCVDFVLPPDEIGRELARISRHPYVIPTGRPPELSAEKKDLAELFEVLRNATGADFSHYKRNTLYRRVARRMVLHKLELLADYLRFLQESPAELQALYQDILINVTSFFRNPESFEALKSKVFPALTEGRSRHDPVRIWVQGCSTGEEAYSLAIAFAEFQDASPKPLPVQIFASDLNARGIDKARTGIFSKNIASDVSPERLRRFFDETDGKYQVSKAIREMCIFARHDVLTDPPFSRLDLITCRNLLIYMEPVLQQRLIPIFHYSLVPTGFLWLGSSETIGSFRELFEIRDTKHKIYAKKLATTRLGGLPLAHPARRPAELVPVGPRTREPGVPASVEAQREADRLLLSRYAPAGVLIDASDEIIQFRGDTGPYLTPAPGRASLNLLKMLREGLLVAVRGALSRVRRDEIAIRESGLRVKSEGGLRTVDVHLMPVRTPGTSQDCVLVLFEDSDRFAAAPHLPRPVESSSAAYTRTEETASQEVERLEQELGATREYLQSVIEKQETSNGDLQSANEEIQSVNEELQSINEELETSKEEIQSSNEELSTVNDELHNRVQQLADANNDMLNVLSGVQMAIVMLGRDLRIRWFTPAAEKLLNLIPSDIGRPLSDFKLNFEMEDLDPMLTEVIDNVVPREMEVQDKQGRWYSLRIRPYRTLENKIEGALLVLVDVDRLKRDQQTVLRQSELLEQAHEPIVVWDPDGAIQFWNRGAEVVYGYSKEEALGKIDHELLKSSVPFEALTESLDRTGQWTGELVQTCKDGSEVVVECRLVLVRTSDGKRLVLKTDRPITEQKLREQALRERAEALIAADRQRNEFLATLAHELRNPLASIRNAAQLLRSRAASGDQELAKETIERQVLNMVQMVDDLLDVSRVTRGRIQLRKEVIDVAAIVERAVRATHHACLDRQQDLSVTLPREPLYVDVDPTRFEQVLNNLLFNAFEIHAAGWARLADGRARGSRSGSENGPTGVADRSEERAGARPGRRHRHRARNSPQRF